MKITLTIEWPDELGENYLTEEKILYCIRTVNPQTKCAAAQIKDTRESQKEYNRKEIIQVAGTLFAYHGGKEAKPCIQDAKIFLDCVNEDNQTERKEEHHG